MTLRSTARDAYHVALDFWGCLRRFADGKAVNGYDDHMAGLLAEAGGKQAGRDLADALAEGKSRNEYLGPYESPENFTEAIERLTECELGVLPTFGIGCKFAPSDVVHISAAEPSTDCPVHGQWCQTPGPAPWCRQPTQISAAPVLRPDDSADSPAHGSPSPEACAGHPPTFTAAELVDAAGAVTRMALLRGVASGNVAYWLTLSAKFYDAADAICTETELVTLGNDPDSVHERTLRHEDERQK